MSYLFLNTLLDGNKLMLIGLNSLLGHSKFFRVPEIKIFPRETTLTPLTVG